jgi:hypothetical protein
MEQEKSKWFAKSTPGDRLIFLAVFLAICFVFGVFWLAKEGFVNVGPGGGCALKRNFGLPCPTCGFTTSIDVFVKGGIIKAFWIQPAAAASCVILLFVAFFSLLSAILGVNFSFLPPVRLWQPKYILIAGLIIFAAGWVVTISRALAELP